MITIKEAIGALNVCKESRIFMPSAETIDIAVESMEKQIPKKCEIYTAIQPRMTFDNEVDVYECPTCGTHIGVADENNQYPHCWNCGQALDWEEGGTSD